MGYRYYDSALREVAYPFGFGLSYTTFDITDTSVEAGENSAEVTVTVRNSGDRSGSSVVQVYVHDASASIDRPAQELKGFAKVHLDPDESATVTITLDSRAFAYWSVTGKGLGDRGRRLRDPRRLLVSGHRNHRHDHPGRERRRRHARRHVDHRRMARPSGRSAVLGAAMAAAAGDGAQAVSPEMMALAGSMPLGKLATFGLGITEEQVEQLVAAAAQPAS